MNILDEQKDALVREINKLRYKKELSEKVGDDYYEPGLMEHLDKYRGDYESSTGDIILCFESKGVRYDGRTEMIERLNAGETVQVVRDEKNSFNANNFRLIARGCWDIGNMPAELCNVIAPLYDAEYITFDNAEVSYVEPLSKRSRYAKQPVLFIKLNCSLKLPNQ